MAGLPGEIAAGGKFPSSQSSHFHDTFSQFRKEHNANVVRGACPPALQWRQPADNLAGGGGQRLLLKAGSNLRSAIGPIVLKNSKIATLRESRKCCALAISAAARLRRIDTRASDRFCGNRCGPPPRSERRTSGPENFQLCDRGRDPFGARARSRCAAASSCARRPSYRLMC